MGLVKITCRGCGGDAARKRNFAAAGLDRNGNPKRRRKPTRVTSQRLPGQAMIGSKR